MLRLRLIASPEQRKIMLKFTTDKGREEQSDNMEKTVR